MEITSKKLNLLYKLDMHEYKSGLVIGTASKVVLDNPNWYEPLDQIWIPSVTDKGSMEQKFIDWAHNDIATELQGVIDDDDIMMEIRIWNRGDFRNGKKKN